MISIANQEKGHGMCMAYFKRDLIEERDRKEKIKRSVIKSWNVRYFDEEAEALMQAQLEAQMQAQREEEERLREAQEIFDRLERERMEDEAKKQAEIDQAYLAQAYKEAEIDAQKWLDENFNSFTGAFSGSYGQGEVDEADRDRINMILHEKDAALRGIIDTEKAD